MDPFYIALILYFAALGLAFVDLFVPSSGTLLLMSGLAAIASVLFGFRSGTTSGMGMLTLVLVSIPGFIVLAIKIWPLTPIGKRVILPAQSPDVSTTTEIRQNADEQLIGEILLAEAPLMPSGFIRIEGKSRKAIARAGFIEAGQNVEIVGFKDFNFVVVPSMQTPTLANSAVVENEPNRAESDAKESDGNLLDLPADELGLDSLD